MWFLNLLFALWNWIKMADFVDNSRYCSVFVILLFHVSMTYYVHISSDNVSVGCYYYTEHIFIAIETCLRNDASTLMYLLWQRHRYINAPTSNIYIPDSQTHNNSANSEIGRTLVVDCKPASSWKFFRVHAHVSLSNIWNMLNVWKNNAGYLQSNQYTFFYFPYNT